MKVYIIAGIAMVAFAQGAASETTAVFGERDPLIEAVRSADRDAVQAELEQGSNVAQPDALGRTALHYAAALGYDGILESLLESSGEPNLRDGDGITPLMRAAQNGHLNTVEMLLERGADTDLRDDSNRTAANFAADHPDILKLLETFGK